MYHITEPLIKFMVVFKMRHKACLITSFIHDSKKNNKTSLIPITKSTKINSFLQFYFYYLLYFCKSKTLRSELINHLLIILINFIPLNEILYKRLFTIPTFSEFYFIFIFILQNVKWYFPYFPFDISFKLLSKSFQDNKL